jgi:hypothetical protein
VLQCQWRAIELKENEVGAEGKENTPYPNQRWASSTQSSVKLGGLLRGGLEDFSFCFYYVISFLLFLINNFACCNSRAFFQWLSSGAPRLIKR